MSGTTGTPTVVAVIAAVVCLAAADRMAPRFGWGRGPSYVVAIAVVVGLTVIAGYLTRS